MCIAAVPAVPKLEGIFPTLSNKCREGKCEVLASLRSLYDENTELPVQDRDRAHSRAILRDSLSKGRKIPPSLSSSWKRHKTQRKAKLRNKLRELFHSDSRPADKMERILGTELVCGSQNLHTSEPPYIPTINKEIVIIRNVYAENVQRDQEKRRIDPARAQARAQEIAKLRWSEMRKIITRNSEYITRCINEEDNVKDCKKSSQCPPFPEWITAPFDNEVLAAAKRKLLLDHSPSLTRKGFIKEATASEFAIHVLIPRIILKHTAEQESLPIPETIQLFTHMRLIG